MQKRTIQVSFFWTMFLGIFLLSFYIFKPFLGVIFLSSILAVFFHPLYEFFLKKFKNKENLSSLLTVVVVLVVIVVPTTFLSTILLKEAADLYNSLAFGQGGARFVEGFNVIVDKFELLLSRNAINADFDITSYMRGVLTWIISHFDSVFSAIFGGLFKFILMLLSLYYLLVNGRGIKNTLIYLSPLPDKYDEGIAEELKASFDAVLRGLLVVAIGQGLFMGIGFLIFGIGNPVLWGFIASLTSFVPTVGTALITIPAATYLFLSGSFWAGVGMLFWGAFAVGLIDNVLSIFFLKGKIKVHPLIILFSILGAVQLFGPIGFLAGPVVVSSFVALGRIYPFIISSKQ